MERKLCKFCGKEMNVKMDHYDDYYHCNCEGQKQLDNLNHEIHELEKTLREKQQERLKHISNSLFENKIRQLHSEIDKIENTYMDDSYNPALIKK